MCARASHRPPVQLLSSQLSSWCQICPHLACGKSPVTHTHIYSPISTNTHIQTDTQRPLVLCTHFVRLICRHGFLWDFLSPPVTSSLSVLTSFISCLGSDNVKDSTDESLMTLQSSPCVCLSMFVIDWCVCVCVFVLAQLFPPAVLYLLPLCDSKGMRMETLKCM